MKNIIKERNEKFLNKYTINCIPFKGERFLGKLYITDKALYYDAQYDMSLDGILDQIGTAAAVSEGHAIMVSQSIKDQWKSEGYMHIPKSKIKAVIKEKSFFKKTVTLVLKDEQQIVFDYGMMGVDKLERDIKARD